MDIIIIVAVIVIALIVVTWLQCRENAERRAQGLPPIPRHDVHDGDTRMIYSIRHTPEEGASFAERCKGGQRPFGEDSTTRRTERNRARADRFYW